MSPILQPPSAPPAATSIPIRTSRTIGIFSAKVFEVSNHRLLFTVDSNHLIYTIRLNIHMTILLLSPVGDVHFKAVADILRGRGAKVIHCDLEQFPERLQLATAIDAH